MQPLFEAYSFIFGLLIGSFLNVVILRLPVGKNLVSDRSCCPKCQAKLRWYHNIPVVSFLMLRGKCAFCQSPISWRYPLIELLTGLVSLWLFPAELSSLSLGFYLFYFAIACVFICHFFIDLDHHLLLDKLNIYLLVLILPFAVLNFYWMHWLLGGLFGFGVPLLITWLFYKIKGQVGLGGGDIKLFGLLGLLLGPTGVFFTIFLSCMVGAIVGMTLILTKKLNKDRPMAFGPAIILVASFQIFLPQFAHIVESWFF